MNQEVNFRTKLNIDGEENIVSASADVKDLAENITEVIEQVQASSREFIKWSECVSSPPSPSNRT